MVRSNASTPSQPTISSHVPFLFVSRVRLVGYAGLPFVMAWPALYLSIKSIVRISKTNRHLQRARPVSDDFIPVPPRSSRSRATGKAMSLIPSVRTVFPPPSPTGATPTPRREAIQPAIASPPGSARKFHLPFKAPGAVGYAEKRTSSSLAMGDGQLMDDASSGISQVSVSFPTFVNPDADAPPFAVESVNTGCKETAETRKEGLEERDWEDGSSHGKGTRNSEQATDMEWREDKLVRLEEEDEDEDDGDVVAKEEYVMSFSGDLAYSPRPASTLYQHKSRRPTPNLAPAVWRIILFQV